MSIESPVRLQHFGTERVDDLFPGLASGLDERPPVTRPPPPDLVVEAELDPPAERVDTAAFIGRALADELHTKLSARGHVCTRLLVTAETVV